MELMSTSLDKFYKYVYCALEEVIPEEILGKITLAVGKGLTFSLRHFNFIMETEVMNCILSSTDR